VAAPIFRSILFTPGIRSDRFDKAVNSGADVVCFDLEDSVLPNDKELARKRVIRYLQHSPPPPCTRFVRINSLETPEGILDLADLLKLEQGHINIMVPKVNSAEPLELISSKAEEANVSCRTIPLIEEPKGVRNALEIAEHPLAIAVALGLVDLAAALGAQIDWDALLLARSNIIYAAAEAGKSAIDGPFIDIKAPQQLANEARAVAKLGYSGKLAIHPNQVATINEAFTPSKEQLEKDVYLVELASTEGVTIVDGKMVDKPVIDAARRRLELAKQIMSQYNSPAAH
jgi:citrate lyase beta subunit